MHTHAYIISYLWNSGDELLVWSVAEKDSLSFHRLSNSFFCPVGTLISRSHICWFLDCASRVLFKVLACPRVLDSVFTSSISSVLGFQIKIFHPLWIDFCTVWEMWIYFTLLQAGSQFCWYHWLNRLSLAHYMLETLLPKLQWPQLCWSLRSSIPRLWSVCFHGSTEPSLFRHWARVLVPPPVFFLQSARRWMLSLLSF